jgi:uncharacterized protein with FMN-binding domain
LRRAVLTLGGTVAGLAALFSFRTHVAVPVAAVSTPTDSASAAASAGRTGPVYPTASSLAPPTTKPSATKSKGATKAPTMTAPASTAPAGTSPTTTKSTPTTAPTTKKPTAPASSAPPTTAAPTTAAPKTYTGSDVNTQYGPMEVQITVTGSKITAVNELEQPDDSIAANAISQLNSEAMSAQSASIQAVSGATYTSNGYIQSLQSAVDQAGL